MSWGETKTIWDRIDRVDDVTGAEALYSDNHILYDLVFEQNNIGARLNKMFNLNSSGLASCTSVEQIAESDELITLLASNNSARSIAVKNSVLLEAMYDYLDNDEKVAYGLIDRFNVGDIINLTYNNTPTPFVLVAKNYKVDNSATFMAYGSVGTSTFSQNTNSSKYTITTMRTVLNSTVLSKFKQIIQDAMLTPSITYYYKTSADTSVPVLYDVCEDKVWLPSVTELYTVPTKYYGKDDIADIRFPATKNENILFLNGNTSVNSNYWTRSMYYYNSNGYRYNIAVDWDYSYGCAAVNWGQTVVTQSNNVRPCFMVGGV